MKKFNFGLILPPSELGSERWPGGAISKMDLESNSVKNLTSNNEWITVIVGVDIIDVIDFDSLNLIDFSDPVFVSIFGRGAKILHEFIRGYDVKEVEGLLVLDDGRVFRLGSLSSDDFYSLCAAG